MKMLFFLYIYIKQHLWFNGKLHMTPSLSMSRHVLLQHTYNNIVANICMLAMKVFHNQFLNHTWLRVSTRDFTYSYLTSRLRLSTLSGNVNYQGFTTENQYIFCNNGENLTCFPTFLQINFRLMMKFKFFDLNSQLPSPQRCLGSALNIYGNSTLHNPIKKLYSMRQITGPDKPLFGHFQYLI